MCFKGDPVRVLVIPGLHDSAPAHWQTWLQAHYGRQAVRVVQDDWHEPDLARWAQRIGTTLARQPCARWVAVAHSFGCLALMQHLSLVDGLTSGEGVLAALLVAPADPAKLGIAGEMPQAQIAVPSVMLASENDPWLDFGSAAAWARVWGSQLISLGNAGHVNSEAGFGPLPPAKRVVEAMIQRLQRERRIERAHALDYSFAI